MKYLSSLLALCLLAVTGCKTNDNANVGPSLLRLGVSTAAGYSLLKHPEAAPGVKAGAAIVCSVAYSTNVNPATIVAAMNANDPLSREAVFILNAAIGAYTLTFNGLADTNDVATIRPYAIAVCDGLRDATLLIPDGAAPMSVVVGRNVMQPQVPGWPQVRFK